jgi:hypothetical protein
LITSLGRVFGTWPFLYLDEFPNRFKLKRMNDLIQRLVNAIFRQEGMPADFKNPGNLRGAPWLEKPNISAATNFWLPESRAEGVAGAAHVIALRIAEGESLRTLISAWAPPSDGNATELYIQHVKEWASIPDENVPLWSFLETSVS